MVLAAESDADMTAGRNSGPWKNNRNFIGDGSDKGPIRQNVSDFTGEPRKPL
jgi:hypothetical protein